MTIDYYNRNAYAFQQRTLGRDLRHRYDAFLALLPTGAEILDAGCGSGRDSLAFIQRGYRVIAIDASSAMVDLTTTAIGQSAMLLPFDQIDFEAKFDGVWASASLLHVPSARIDDAVHRLTRALKAGGVLYMSVKIGDGERIAADGRLFCDYTQVSLTALFSRHPALAVLDMHTSPPAAGQSDGKSWLHAMARKIIAEKPIAP
jgi:SAM-dependent methyltransferase